MQLAELPSKRREDARRRGELSRSRRCRILAEYYTYIMPYKKESGAQSRKRRKIETEQQAKLAGSLHRFLKAKGKSSFGKSSGFNARRKLSPRLLEHERSSYHLSAFTMWKELEMRLHKQETIDAAAQLAQQRSFEKWKAILVRILDCVLYLARQTLPLRGHSEDLNTVGNCGNFLETFKLLAKYDPVAKQHLHRVQRTDGYIVSYLSPQSQNEFISLLGDHIRTVIFQNIIKAKYFAIMFDSTPDISHTDQMSQVIRYVHIEDSGVHVTESFIDFIQLYGKSADVITKQICDKLQADGLKLEHCYGQGYDNAATMAGHISGVQKRILDMNPKAMFVPCNNHSLNLAGMHAVGVGTKSVTFFGTVEKVYAFFSSSTHRWDILKKHVPIRVKQSCNTRWSSKHEAVCVLAEHTEKIKGALEALRDGPEETSETRGDAGSLLVCIMTYVFFSFLHFWNPELTEVNDTQIYLQQEGLALDQCVQKLKALALFCHEKRDSLVSKATEKALQVCKTYCIPTERRVGRRKKMDGENSCDAGLTLIQESSREQLEAIDQLQAEIKKRTTQMNTLHQRFAFLQIQTLLDTGKDDFIKKQIQHTCAQYTELNAPSMLTEITRLRHHIILYKEVNPDEQVANWSALDLLRWVKWDALPHWPKGECMQLAELPSKRREDSRRRGELSRSRRCRKRRKIETEQQAKLAGSLHRFLVSTAEITAGPSAAPQETHNPDPVSVDIPVPALEAETVSSKDVYTQPNLPENIDQKVYTDIGYWPETMDETLKTELVRRGTEELQNKDAWFQRDSNGRSFSKDWFYIHLENGETMLRTWLVFSPVNNAAYCFPCMLFQKAKGKSSFGKSSGFNARRKLSPRLLEHERSSYHLSAFTMWKELEMRLHKQETIDAAAQLAQQRSFEKWKAILVRILDCVLYLARQTLPLRGHSEDLNTVGNCGNFLETFKLLAKYDPVAKQHLHRVQRTDGYIVSYLSPQSQNEFISLLGDHIRTVIFQNIIKAKYFAIMFDSTPDISHTDQMSQVIRYVHIEDSGVHVTESFIDFIQLYGKSADVITKQICDKLQADGLKLEHCYGQGYDNAATMAGHISGVQKRILDMNPKAMFVPCNNHSLNLAGMHAVGVGTKSVTLALWKRCMHFSQAPPTELTEVNDTQIYLQQEGLALDQCVQKLKALALFCHEKRDSLVSKATEKALQVCKTYCIPTERRVGRRKKMNGENSCDAGLTLIQETSREQLEAIDQLQAEIKKHTTQMNTLHQRFAFLQIQTLLDTGKDDFIKKQIQHTCAQYTELNAPSMLTEIPRLRHHIILYKEVNPDEEVANWSALDLLRWVKWDALPHWPKGECMQLAELPSKRREDSRRRGELSRSRRCRKRRKIETEQQAKLAGSLHRFLVSTAEITAGPSAAPQETHNPDPVSVDIPVPALEAETVSSKDVYTQPNLPENIDQKVYTDIGYWPETMDETLKTELVRRGTEELQNKDAWFQRDSNGRSFSKDWFYIHLENGETMLRTWLVFSPVNNAAYCFPCMLFQKAKGKSSFGKSSGFNARRKLSPRLLEHERSSYHLSAFTMWKELEMRLHKQETIDAAAQLAQQRSFEKWKAILVRILDCVLYLARQTLPLRGHSEDLNTVGNCGNFLETFKLLAKYDPVAKQHLHRVQRTDGYIVSYLSPQSQNEFISLLGDHIRTVIFQNIIKAKYFAIMFDSTPDISHTDHMSQVIRYVHIEDSGVHVTESFIDFIQLYGKSADVITKQICDKLQADGLKLEHCYGQGYDNAATMAGHISGVQKRILDMNPKAMFVPCNNHSLNLAGMHAVGVGTKSVTLALWKRCMHFSQAPPTELTEVNDTQIYLQQEGLALDQCVQKLKALALFCHEKRDSLVSKATEKALQVCKTYCIPTERRVGRRKKMNGENSCDAGLTLIQETSREQLEAIDQLQAEIKKHTTQMNTLHQRFAFLQIQTLLDTGKDDFIKKQIQHTCAQYTELNAPSMLTEIPRLRHHIILYKEVNPDEEVANWSALDLLRWVKWDALPHWPKGECMQLAELPSKRREDSRRRGELSRSRRCRKRRKIETEQQAKLAGSLHRFLVSTAEITAGPSAAPQETHNPDPVSVDIPVPALEAETVSSKDVYTQPNLPENIDQKVYTDIGYWPETMDETLKTELVRRGTEELQNKDAWFQRDSNGRSFSKDWFYIHLENGETMLRTWLVFSPVNNAAYCFPCMLFQKAKGKSSFGKSSGFNARRKLSPRLLEHERSSYHLSAFTMWKELEMRLHKQETIDAAAQLAQQRSFEKWKAILVRILDCVLYLARQTLPLRGHSEDLNTVGNCGNFLETFKLLAKYDPVAKQHLHRVQRTDGYIVSYLSPQSQNEFISLLGDHIRTVIFQNIIKAKYFAIMFDSTPDISHTDQMSQVIRYVHIEDSGVHVTESFIDFIQLYGKSADVITKQICDKLQADGLKLEHCYGQGYDNAATMAGHISGVQKRILDMNPKAMFVPCNNHSLNLAGMHAVGVGTKSVTLALWKRCMHFSQAPPTELTEVNDTQIYLQQEGLALDQCVQKLKALALFCHEKRDSLVSKATEKALQVCKTYCIPTERRVGRRKKMNGENSCDAGLTLIQETSREQLEAIDQLQAEIKKHTTQMNTLHQRFAFLQIQTLLDTGKDDFIKKQIQHTCAQYTELNAPSMLTEIPRLRHHIILYKEVNPDEEVANWSALDLLRWVKWDALPHWPKGECMQLAELPSKRREDSRRRGELSRSRRCRKRRKIETEQQAKLAGSLHRFLVSTAEITAGPSAAPQETHNPDPVSVDIPVPALEAETVSSKDVYTQPNLPENIDQKVYTDIGYWPETMDETLKTELVRRGTEELQNKDAWFQRDSNGRSFSKDWFYIHLENGETMLRTWLVFSPVNNAAYCFPCMLFQKAKGKSSFGKSSGFNARRKLSPRLLEHERSSYHLSAFTMWKELEMRLHKQETIDAAAQLAQQRSFEKWKAILVRILDCVLYLARQTLPLRGHSEDLNTVGNCGNFLETFKLLAKYDPVAKQHLHRVQRTDGYIVSYLSPQSQNEFISLLGDHIRTVIFQNIIKAKYFAIMFDSTPDISHTDQMSQVIRYVHIEDSGVHVTESFIDFIQLYGKSADVITKQICDKLQADGLKLEHCYGQGYDNAATMAGHISGVQKRILDMNPKAMFVPCNNHSLNLAGMHAVGVGTKSVTLALWKRCMHFSQAPPTELTEVNDTQIYLQQEGLALDQCVQKLKALALFCHEKRDSLVSKATEKALQVCKTYCIPTERRVGRRKKMDGENSCDAGLTLIQETSREQLEAIDQLQAEIKKHTTQMNTLHQRFAFLQIQTLLDTGKDDFIKKQIQHTCAQYTELNAPSMLTEIPRLRHHIILYKEVNPDEQVANWSALDLLRWVYKWKLQES
ncbi:hypothetical protein NDU88_001553 [Pleurodeles waltl]|uniref:TTF-type domain-containing protein n=1 Tax=Pleurodeles waltl TaxID=8319 RepID=A0AAV7NB29_PLEWA|nr:hypothetical protein NDU88_001553 [Pleurodeles waltl]